MKPELVNNKNKLVALLLFSLFAIGILWISIGQPIDLIVANKKVITWINWIVLYFIAQFMVAVFIGRAIRGSEAS